MPMPSMDGTISVALKLRHQSVSSAVLNTDGLHMNDGKRKIDFILVYNDLPNHDNSSSHDKWRKFYQDNLELEGVELESDERTIDNESIMFVKVHVPWRTMCKYAEELKIKTPLWTQDESAKEDKDLTQKTGGKSTYFSLNSEDDNKVTLCKPFHQKNAEHFAIRDQKTYFTDIQRIEITEAILETIQFDRNNLKLRGISKLIEEKVYVCAYPLHDCELDVKNEKVLFHGKRQLLHTTWANWKMIFKHQPLMDIRNYYGEQIAFYFAWMDVYARMLVWPSIAGMVTFIYGIISFAYSPENDEICKEEDNHELIDHFNVAPLIMCPICKPPDCEAWEMISEGCFQYTWNYRIDNEWSIFLSAFTSLWGIIFLKVWRRRESFLAAEWDTEDAEENDTRIRADYAEVSVRNKRNPITLQSEPYIPLKKTQMWLLGSILGTVLFLLFTGLCLGGLVLSRIQLYGAMRPVVANQNIVVSRWLTHGLLLIMIMVLEIIFSKVAERLTNFERPKTQRQWMKSFLWKIFIFQFINDFVPIAYAAWIKGKTAQTPLDLDVADELCDGGCIGEVTEIVAVLLLLRLVLANTAELGLPMVQTAWKRFRLKQKISDDTVIPQYVKDFHLNGIELDGVSDDLMQMMIQFAFNVLFIPALPVAPLVCLINTLIQIRLDSIKYLETRQRAVPIRTSSIKIWDQFLDITSKLGVIVNAAMLAFTSDNIPKLYYKLVYYPGHDIHGFTRFSLDSVPTEDYPIPREHNEMLEKNITRCWYPNFRQSEPPFPLLKFWYEIFTYRLAAFAVFIILLFTVMWLVNTFVSDVPRSVKERIERKKYLIGKIKDVSHGFTTS